MSFIPANKEQQEKLHDLFYRDKMMVGRDALHEVYHRKYPDDTLSQRSTLDWLKKPEIYQNFRKPTHTRAAIRPIVAKKRGSISLDCVVMPNYNGYTIIYNCLDIYSRRYYALPFKAQTAENTIEFFKQLQQQYPNFTVSYIQSDLGSEFKEPFHSWAEEQGWTHAYSSPHSPWQNIIERHGGSMKRMLFMAMKADDTSNWVDLLPQVTTNLNNRVSFATGKTPLELDQSTDPELQRQVNTKVQNRKNKQYGNIRSGTDIAVGDWVKKLHDYDATRIQKASKRGYYGSQVYEVIRVIKSKNPWGLPSYKIANKDTGDEVPGSVARWQLQPVPKQTQFNMTRQVTRPSPEVDSEGEERYKVESILRKRVKRDGSVQYLVNWMGWNKPTDNTWQDEEELMEDAPEMVEQFNRGHR